MTRPAAEKPAEDERGNDKYRKENRPGVDRAGGNGMPRFGWFQWRERAAEFEKQPDVNSDEQVHNDQRDRAPPAHLCAGAAIAVDFEDGQREIFTVSYRHANTVYPPAP